MQAEIKCQVQICKSKRRELSEDQVDLTKCCFSLQSASGSPYKFLFALSLQPPDFAQDLFLLASPSSPSPSPIYTPIFQIDSLHFPPEPFSLIVSFQSPLQMLPRPLSSSAASKMYFAHICPVNIVKYALSSLPFLLQADSLDRRNLGMHAYNYRVELGCGTKFVSHYIPLLLERFGAPLTTLLTLRYDWFRFREMYKLIQFKVLQPSGVLDQVYC